LSIQSLVCADLFDADHVIHSPLRSQRNITARNDTRASEMVFAHVYCAGSSHRPQAST
jgi:hypothetical protein